MDSFLKKYLVDIQSAISNIENYLGEKRIFEEYTANNMLKQAVERNLEIIGEAITRILKIQSGISISDSRRIVNARNKIIHGYDEIEDVTIWAIIINHLPLLKKEVKELLQNN